MHNRTPPPPPEIIPPPLPSSMERGKPTKLQQMARASFLAPMVALVIGFLTIGIRTQGDENSRSTELFVGIFNLSLCAVGLCLGIVSLAGWLRLRQKRVLTYTLAGLIINGVIITGFLAVLGAAKNSSAKQAQLRQQALASAEQEGRDQFLNNDGWYGAENSPQLIVAVTQFTDDFFISKQINAPLPRRCTVANVSVRSAATNPEYRIDLGKVLIVLKNGKVIHCLNTQMIQSARSDRQALERLAGVRTLAAGKELPDGVLLIPTEIPADSIEGFVVPLSDSQSVTVHGRIFTAKEKQDLVQRGTAAQSQR